MKSGGKLAPRAGATWHHLGSGCVTSCPNPKSRLGWGLPTINLFHPDCLLPPEFPSLIPKPSFCQFQASGLLQRGAKIQSSLSDLGFLSRSISPYGTTDIRGVMSQACRERAGRCQGDSSCTIGDAELVSGPGSLHWPGLKMLTLLH